MCKNLYGKTSVALLLPWLIWLSSSGMNNDKKIVLRGAPKDKIVTLLGKLRCAPNNIYDLGGFEIEISNQEFIDIEKLLARIDSCKKNIDEVVDDNKSHREERSNDITNFRSKWYGVSFLLGMVPGNSLSLLIPLLCEAILYSGRKKSEEELNKRTEQAFAMWNNLNNIKKILQRQVCSPLVANLFEFRNRETLCNLGINFADADAINTKLKIIHDNENNRIKKPKITDFHYIQKALTPSLVGSTNKLILDTALKLPKLFIKDTTKNNICYIKDK
jgi:hypothetical protein